MASFADTGLMGIAALARMNGLNAYGPALAHELAIHGRHATPDELIRAAGLLGLTARLFRKKGIGALDRVEGPAMLRMNDGRYVIYRRGEVGTGIVRDPRSASARNV